MDGGEGGGYDAGGASAASPAHLIELLAPLYPEMCAVASASPASASRARFPLALRRAADGRVKLRFTSLGSGLEKHAACLNGEDCACGYVHLLGDLLELEERGLLRVATEYVVHGSPAATAATIRLDVTLHEDHGSRGGDISLQEFEFVLCHLQVAVLNVVEWRGRQLSDADAAAARQSACHVVGCRLHPSAAASAGVAAERLQLAEVFSSLTSQASVQQMPVRDDKTYRTRMRASKEAETETADSARGVILTDLPTTALQTVVLMLNARDLAQISGVCSMFQNMAYEVVPGLNLVLYEHQRRGLKWMLRRESALASRLSTVAHPFTFPSTVNVERSADVDTNAKVIDLVDCKMVERAQAVVQDTRGGLLCDEPGLGKTITVLALILRTLGQRSKLRNTLESQASSTNLLVSRPSTGVTLRSRHRGRTVAPSELVCSGASLIVVPDALVEHWRYQVELHVAPGALSTFIDTDDKAELPKSAELARFDVVITSFSRLTREWKFHRPPSALEMRMPDRFGFEDTVRYADGQARGEVSSLLTINWIRVVVDEGHKLGGKSTTNIMLMARLISAERRWVMTGTPTPSTDKSTDLLHMHGLLVFLRNLPYGDTNGKAWTKAIAWPFELNQRIGFLRLQHLLSHIMLRHTKESIKDMLPQPIRQVVLIDPTPTEHQHYNSVVGIVRGNLVTTGMDPKDPGRKHHDSLLNPVNRRSALLVVKNLREATCGGSTLRVNLSSASRVETINMLHSTGVDGELVGEVIEYLRRVQIVGMETACACCSRLVRILMLIPCGHMSCADCIEANITDSGHWCFKCGKRYDPEDFQRLQPGFEFSYIDDDAAADPRHQGRRQRTGRRGRHGRQGRLGQATGGDDAAPIEPWRPINLETDFATVDASKPFYVVARVRELCDEYARGQYAPAGHPNSQFARSGRRNSRSVKAIIFSQFKEHIWRTRVAFAQQRVKTANFIAGLTLQARKVELLRFRNDPSVNVLLLTEAGSHGLDLSFVTHLFLMDEIWDKALEQQVVSRAHRMGATQSVVVEQLVLRDSIESIMASMGKAGAEVIQRSEDDRYSEEGTAQQRSLEYVLTRLKLLPDSARAEPGQVRFVVLNQDQQMIRRGVHMVSGPTERAVTSSVEFPEVVPVSDRRTVKFAQCQPSDSQVIVIDSSDTDEQVDVTSGSAQSKTMLGKRSDCSDEEEKQEPVLRQPPRKQQRSEVSKTEVTSIAGRAVTVVTFDDGSDEDDIDAMRLADQAAYADDEETESE